MHSLSIVCAFLFPLFNVCCIEAISIEGVNYAVLKSNRCQHCESRKINASTAITCVSKCGVTHGCKSVNFKSPECELLEREYTFDVPLVEALGWRFICKYLLYV